MEIKSCEQYVLAELDSYKKQLEEANEVIERLETEIEDLNLLVEEYEGTINEYEQMTEEEAPCACCKAEEKITDRTDAIIDALKSILGEL